MRGDCRRRHRVGAVGLQRNMRDPAHMPELRHDAAAPRVHGVGHLPPARELLCAVQARHMRIALALLADGRAFSARLVGRAPEHDLAVLHIGVGSDRPPPIPIGTSNELRVGQSVFAIGNPFGLDWTMTTGIVSALGRELPGEGSLPIRGLIQTDAAINPGNSGGPLLNSRGELIGINTAIYSTSGSSAGIGFAVPVNIVKRVVPQLIKYGKVIRPGLGVSTIDDNIARRWRIKGVIIHRVQPGGAADRAGLNGIVQNRWGEIRLGDIITGINGKPVTNFDELGTELERYQIGEVVTVNILRGDRETSVKVRLQEL
ncbi:PDZ domain-containing protein [candidate division KSB1 bacterium]|nr:PDZ domain-containing protein [candidate division KSB1 bacterium]